MGRITKSFRMRFMEELRSLKQFREALMDPGRRDAVESLIKTWGSKMGAMSYVNIPTTLDVMLLTSAVDDRKQLLKIIEELETIKTKIEKLENAVDV